jgi:hypothetical protein
MIQHDPRVAFDLGQCVRVDTDRAARVGRLVAVMLTPPYEGLVRWSRTESTFEPLDRLVEAAAPAHDALAADGSWPPPDAGR